MHRPVVLVLFLLVVAAAVVLLHLAPGLDNFIVEIQMRNGLHVIGFAAVAALTIAFVPGGALIRSIAALLVSAAIGSASEFAQLATGSAFDVNDLFRDIAGAALFVVAWFLWTAPKRFELSALWGTGLRIAAAISLLAIFAPFGYWAGVFVVARSQAPVIHDFDQPWARYFVSSINATHSFVGSAEGAHLAVTLGSRPRSGMTLAAATRNWRAAEQLAFDAWVTHDAPVQVSIHINDRRRIGRFRDSEAGTVRVNQAPTTYRISIADVLSETQAPDNVGSIRQIVFFARDRTEGAVLSVDNVRLE